MDRCACTHRCHAPETYTPHITKSGFKLRAKNIQESNLTNSAIDSNRWVSKFLVLCNISSECEPRFDNTCRVRFGRAPSVCVRLSVVSPRQFCRNPWTNEGPVLILVGNLGALSHNNVINGFYYSYQLTGLHNNNKVMFQMHSNSDQNVPYSGVVWTNECAFLKHTL